jgi:hypothetical protein
VNENPGPVREEAERLVAAVLARLAMVRALTGQPPVFDPEHAGRIAHAVGDVAESVTGLLRELGSPGGAGPATGSRLRDGFGALATGLIEAAGVDLHGEPPAPEPRPWQAAPDPDAGDVWRTVTRESQAQADHTHDAERKSGDAHDRG